MELVDEGVNFSGGSRGGAWGPRSPLFFDQNEARRAEKNFFCRPGPPYLRVWFSKLEVAQKNFKTINSAKKFALLGICDYL